MNEPLSAHQRSFPDPNSTGSLHGRVALVTGSTGGLGIAMAEGLALAGCSVMLNGIELPEAVETLRGELEKRTGARIAYHQASVAETRGVEGLVSAALAQFGSLDILVNNAVVRHFSSIVDFPTEHWEAALAVNVSAAFHAIRLALPHMRKRNFGRIFNMTSVYGSRGTINRVDYVTTKAALLGLTRAVALENLDCDVTCHGICPGSVLTPGTEGRVHQLMADEDLSREEAERLFLQGKQPGGRFIPVRSVTDLLVFLCGPIARDMTGAILPVEGGWLAS
jgi:3-hydroxybutyrate dehydrogenase